VNFYGSKTAGRLDSDKELLPDEELRKEQNKVDESTSAH